MVEETKAWSLLIVLVSVLLLRPVPVGVVGANHCLRSSETHEFLYREPWLKKLRPGFF